MKVAISRIPTMPEFGEIKLQTTVDIALIDAECLYLRCIQWGMVRNTRFNLWRGSQPNVKILQMSDE